MLCVPAGLDGGRQRDAWLSRLAGDADWVMPPEDAACGRAVRSACRAAGFEPRVRWTSDDMLVLVRAVADGHGVAVLPRLAVPRTPRAAGYAAALAAVGAALAAERRGRGRGAARAPAPVRRLLAVARTGADAAGPAVGPAVLEALAARYIAVSRLDSTETTRV